MSIDIGFHEYDLKEYYITEYFEWNMYKFNSIYQSAGPGWSEWSKPLSSSGLKQLNTSIPIESPTKSEASTIEALKITQYNYTSLTVLN